MTAQSESGAEDLIDTGQELLGAERLDHEIGNTEFGSALPVCVIALGSQHDDGYVTAVREAAELGKHFEPAELRQHDVQQNEIERIGLPQQCNGRGAVVAHLDIIRALFQFELDDAANVRLVIDDEDSASGLGRFGRH
jgi:hypothetical protein